jgi:hypothetical protein
VNRKYLLATPVLVLVILANWDAESNADQQPVSDLDKHSKRMPGRAWIKAEGFSLSIPLAMRVSRDTLRLRQAILEV